MAAAMGRTAVGEGSGASTRSRMGRRSGRGRAARRPRCCRRGSRAIDRRTAPPLNNETERYRTTIHRTEAEAALRVRRQGRIVSAQKRHRMEVAPPKANAFQDEQSHPDLLVALARERAAMMRSHQTYLAAGSAVDAANKVRRKPGSAAMEGKGCRTCDPRERQAKVSLQSP